MLNLVSVAGLFILMAIAWLFSPYKRRVNWRVIAWGLVFQALVAVFIFYVPVGGRVFLFVNHLVVKLLQSATAGSEFVFGLLALPPGTSSADGASSLGFILAFQGLPTIIFFSALMAILYYYGIMSRVIKAFAYLFTRLMRISGAESLCAASNIFVGAESAFTIRPHIKTMTRSELCTILTAGMSTVASNVLALYIFSLQNQFPTIAGHLISASFLSAPAALIMSKLVLPETGEPVTLGRTVEPVYEKEQSVFGAIINAANSGVRVILSIAALLIAVIGMVSLADLLLGLLGTQLNHLVGIEFDWSLKHLLGYLFYPLTVILGVPLPDAGTVAQIIGERVVLTEVASYQDLGKAIAGGVLTNPRSIVITAYALCGFAHLASVAIFVGAVSALAPSRTQDLAKLGFRALVAATLACLMTACIAGVFYSAQTGMVLQPAG